MCCGSGRPAVHDPKGLAVVQELAARDASRRQGLDRRGPAHPERCEQLSARAAMNADHLALCRLCCPIILDSSSLLPPVYHRSLRGVCHPSHSGQHWRGLSPAAAPPDVELVEVPLGRL